MVAAATNQKHPVCVCVCARAGTEGQGGEEAKKKSDKNVDKVHMRAGKMKGRV